MATLAYLRTVVDDSGKGTGDFECSACGEKFHPDDKRLGAVDTAFVRHRLEYHPLSIHQQQTRFSRPVLGVKARCGEEDESNADGEQPFFHGHLLRIVYFC